MAGVTLREKWGHRRKLRELRMRMTMSKDGARRGQADSNGSSLRGKLPSAQKRCKQPIESGGDAAGSGESSRTGGLRQRAAVN